MTNGKTITTYFINGNPKGIKSVFMPNRTCQCLVVPRNEEQIKNARERDELNTPSLYLLLKNDVKKAYIGESENFNERVIDHHRNKEFWTEAVVFVAKDKSINKTDIKFLECLALEQAKKANLFTLEENIQTPSKPHMPEHQRDSTKDFFDDVQMLASFLGYALFETSHVQKDEYLYITSKNTDAKGVYENGEFRVFAGSNLRKEPTNSYEHKEWRKQQLSDSASEKGESYVLQKDILFTSPSAAANFCIGSNINGWDAWKNKQDITLATIHNAKLAAAE